MQLIGPFTQLLPMDGLPAKGPIRDDMLPVICHGGILVHNGFVQAIGDFQQLKAQYNPAEIEHINGDYVALPGMIDVHTHICWAGSRANDYAMRVAGKSYLEIAASGGGIWDTVQKTRLASLSQLTELTVQRANKLLDQGITTIEIKSGYGLSTEHELKMLKAIAQANTQTQADLVATCLAAHIKPKDFEGSEEHYLAYIANDLLPVVMQQGLAKRVDIFVEKSAFGVRAATAYLQKAKELGFSVVVHGDQFTPGAAALANQVGALSIDHLEAADDHDIELLAKGHTIPVVLPGASLGLGEPFAPARRLLDAGTSLVIASDWNPGSAPMGNLLTQAAVLGAVQRLSIAETLAALTVRAALALNLPDRGILKNGCLADFIAFPTDNYQEILYQQGGLKPGRVWKKGRKAVSS
ncbi:MAG: imidazolonepropionase [Breznakibacter sp.]